MNIAATIQYLTKAAKLLLWGLLLYGLGFAVWTIFFTETGNGDNVEHVHAAWLVAYGKTPYRDFFQHHNPLLWYLFAPFVRLFTDVELLLDIAHAIGIITGILAFYTVFKICVRFFASSFASLLSLLILCPPFFYIYCFNFNPDTFMALFFAIGLYNLFAYWDKPQLYSLVLSFLSFFIAFMFTQKLLAVAGALGIICLGMFYYQKTPLSHILYALILPFMGTMLFLAYLYHQGALELYWKSNYLFNVVMQDYYGDNKVNVANYKVFIFSVGLAGFSALCLFCRENKYYKTIALLLAVELPLRCFYFSLSPYYLLPSMIYTVCLNSVCIDKLVKKSRWLIFLFLGISSYYAYISPSEYLHARGNNRSFVRYLAQNLTPCDYIISGYWGNQSIIYKDPHYYWSMLGHIDLIGAELGIAPLPDLTALTLKYKPKLIYGGIYWRSNEKNRGRNVPLQSISFEVIEKYYTPTPFANFYILKEEYQNKNCHFNKFRKEWLYAN